MGVDEANEGGQNAPAKVVIHDFGETVAMDPLEWPSGDFLLHILTTEKALLLDQHHHHHDIDNAEYWQASARQALLQKFGYLRSDVTNTESKGVPETVRTGASNNSIDIHKVQNCWKEVVHDLQQKNERKNVDEHFDNDLLDLLQSQCQRSNQRTLQWGYMDCPSSFQFTLHAHPTIELVYCVTGALHEIRMQGEPFTKEFEPNEDANDDEAHDNNSKNKKTNKLRGPNLTELKRPWSFGTLSAGQWLVNEVGSIHKSFTATNATGSCQLLVLWHGSHANVQYPPRTPNVPEAVDVMDRQLTTTGCCDCSNPTVISETFLPDSERKKRAEQ